MSQRLPDYDGYRARELASMRSGIWTMSDDEFCRELADAWDEGYEDGRRQDAEGDDGPRFVNPYRKAP